MLLFEIVWKKASNITSATYKGLDGVREWGGLTLPVSISDQVVYSVGQM